MTALADPGLYADLRAFGADEVSACFSCGTCTATCPLVDGDGAFPRRIIRYAQVGLKDQLLSSKEIWSCHSVAGSSMGESAQVKQDTSAGTSRYWMWRFDRTDDPVPLDNFWGKTPEQCVTDLQGANNPQAGNPEGVADVELAVDPYFPKTIPTVPANLKGKTAHGGGRNRLFLDLHAKWLKDIRTD